ncbi:uncharacterized protein BO97DRAFT_431887 [Aspergillus homomorphus CBS 101889]|uniref:Uncharacterized protein n=1 Tax=Aspergillus homomorphus (strain CBS 101889) TaxID=1450537 RepID=A0A395I7I7_ASPHC|nr:hypothetical protein BO97DRAFT_431887 [Aspergillus homomorphus CBS 101889]RAL16182.1 hypothetical protein BO97DRAFT_431887 [Aspergillus homomorphus CBS 101889]
MTPSPFGRLGKLPIELRMTIYEILLGMRPASIKLLCCSRAIYEEITKRLYDTMDIHLWPHVQEPWIDMSCRQLRLRWGIDNHNKHRFSRLPYHKTHLYIHIYAPDRQDPGQIVLLWKRISHLMELLEGAAIRSLTIHLQEHKGCDWQEEGRAVESIDYPGSPRPDHNIVFLPFCTLSKVRSLQVIPASPRMDDAIDWGLINYGREFILHSGYANYNDGPLSGDSQYRDLARLFDDITAVILDTGFFLDTRLDLLPGLTAGRIRLARARDWLPDQGNRLILDPVNRKVLRRIRRCPESVSRHDPDLIKLMVRHWHHWNLYVDSRHGWDRFLRAYWDVPLWEQFYADGLPPFTPDNVYNYWKAVPTNPDHGWTNRGWFEDCGEFEFCLWSYLHRNWGQESVEFRWRNFERYWCTDCRHMGFQAGCDGDCEQFRLFDWLPKTSSKWFL